MGSWMQPREEDCSGYQSKRRKEKVAHRRTTTNLQLHLRRIGSNCHWYKPNQEEEEAEGQQGQQQQWDQ